MYKKKKDHSFKNAFVHHCLLNLMLYDWELLSLSELCPLLLHRMTFYHTASFRQVLIILCSVVIQYCGMGYGLFCSRWITGRQIFLGYFSAMNVNRHQDYTCICLHIAKYYQLSSPRRRLLWVCKKNFNRCSFIVIYFSNFFFFIVCIYVLRSQWNCISFEFAKFWEYLEKSKRQLDFDGYLEK